jgi:hypothetical protein
MLGLVGNERRKVGNDVSPRPIERLRSDLDKNLVF